MATKNNTNPKVAIIGGGNLGTAIATGLIDSGFTKPNYITITRRNTNALQQFAVQGVNINDNNIIAIKDADIILLCVKPYQIELILQHLNKKISPNQIIISVITGVDLKQLSTWIGKRNPIFRAMPNTAIAVKQSMTCISYTNSNTEQIAMATKLFDSVGKTIVIEDALMDAATVLGACGTAYALRFIRAKMQGGIEIGFDTNTAKLIAAQTVLGAASLLLEKNSHPEPEIDKVTTPKGCTIAGLNEMEHQGFSSSLIKGILTSYNKIVK